MDFDAAGVDAAPRIVLAPLRGVTHLSFRKCLAAHFGGIDEAVSPFLTTVEGSKIKATHLADIMPEANTALPLVPQVIGKDPARFRALLVAIRDLGYTRCDLNAGCPWPLIIRKGRGAGLLRDADALRRMLDAGCDVMGDGLSIKVRLGIDEPHLLAERMDILNGYPLREVTIHARTASQRYEGKVDLDAFGECLALTKAPVVYNGDVRSPEGCKAILDRFPSVAGIMIGRGLVTWPDLATRIKAGQKQVPKTTREAWCRYGDFVRDYGERTRAELFGPASFLGRMKEFWSYHKDAYPDGDAIWRRLRVCRSYADYDAVLPG